MRAILLWQFLTLGPWWVPPTSIATVSARWTTDEVAPAQTAELAAGAYRVTWHRRKPHRHHWLLVAWCDDASWEPLCKHPRAAEVEVSPEIYATHEIGALYDWVSGLPRNGRRELNFWTQEDDGE